MRRKKEKGEKGEKDGEKMEEKGNAEPIGGANRKGRTMRNVAFLTMRRFALKYSDIPKT